MPALDVWSGTLGPRETHYLALWLRFRQLSETKLNQAKSSQAKQTKPCSVAFTVTQV